MRVLVLEVLEERIVVSGPLVTIFQVNGSSTPSTVRVKPEQKHNREEQEEGRVSQLLESYVLSTAQGHSLKTKRRKRPELRRVFPLQSDFGGFGRLRFPSSAEFIAPVHARRFDSSQNLHRGRRLQADFVCDLRRPSANEVTSAGRKYPLRNGRQEVLTAGRVLTGVDEGYDVGGVLDAWTRPDVEFRHTMRESWCGVGYSFDVEVGTSA